jgi:hypothetical protein
MTSLTEEIPQKEISFPGTLNMKSGLILVCFVGSLICSPILEIQVGQSFESLTVDALVDPNQHIQSETKR